LRPTRATIASWILRLAIVITLGPHSVGKLIATESFDAKFSVPAWQALTLGAIELAAVLGMIAGGVLVNRYGVWVTRLASVGTVLSQSLAIIYAHHRWLEYVPQGNAEYNSFIILTSIALFVAPSVAFRQRRPSI
jgi:uncharacterized membrane protein YphA (DoxX/SURF4 family)